MDRVGDQFFTDAAFARHQDLRVRPRDPVDFLRQLDDPGAGANQLACSPLTSHAFPSSVRTTCELIQCPYEKTFKVLPASVVHPLELHAEFTPARSLPRATTEHLDDGSEWPGPKHGVEPAYRS